MRCWLILEFCLFDFMCTKITIFLFLPFFLVCSWLLLFDDLDFNNNAYCGFLLIYACCNVIKNCCCFKNNSIVFGVCVFFILLLCAMLNTNVVMNTQIFNVKYNRKRRHIPLSWHVFNKLAFPLLKMEQKRSEILIRLIKKMHAVTVPFSYARQTSWKSIRVFFSVFIYGSFLFFIFFNSRRWISFTFVQLFQFYSCAHNLMYPAERGRSKQIWI